MPTYAILGATGNTGQSLLRVLSQNTSDTLHINAFCRSKSKLDSLVPEITSDPRVKVYEGDITNISTLASCIEGASAIFLAVAVPSSIPNTTIAQDTAKSVVSALQSLRKNSPDGIHMPRLVVLSSASTEERLSRDIPALAHAIFFRALSYVYTDLMLAEEYLRQQQDWLSTTFVKPGALSQDVQKGHRLSQDTAQGILSFMDLAAGMVEIAEGDGEWDMKSVAVVPVSNAKVPWVNVYYVLTGLMVHFFPFVYRFLPY